METILNDIGAKTDPFSNELFSVIPGIGNAEKVTVLDGNAVTEAEFYKHWVHKNKPCLLKGAVTHWPAYANWRDEQYWCDTVEDFEIHINPNRNYNSRDRQTKNMMIMPFHEAVRKLFNGDEAILSIPAEVINPRTSFNTLGKDVGTFSFLKEPPDPRGFPKVRFFLHKKASTGWHYHDVDETLMCQVKGAKAVALLPPNLPQASMVTAFLNNEEYINGHQLDESLKFNPFVTEVEEGDALYIPPYWFHAVVPTDEQVGITVAYCWKSPYHKFGDLSSYLVRKLYLQVLWPFGIYTVLMPFMGVYSIFRYLTYKVFKW